MSLSPPGAKEFLERSMNSPCGNWVNGPRTAMARDKHKLIRTMKGAGVSEINAGVSSADSLRRNKNL